MPAPPDPAGSSEHVAPRTASARPSPESRTDHGPIPTLREAIVLGAVQGVTELLPISSSGHVAVLPWLARSPYAEADAELRKSLEIALHAGTAAALLIALRGEVGEAALGLDRRRVTLLVLSFLPPAWVGMRFERTVEQRLGTPSTIAVGLLLGSAALVLADRRPQDRRHAEAGTLDAVALGLAQATALMPGVSRNGATLAVGRARRFARQDANRLSRHVALPVIAGATVLKGVRLVRRIREGRLPPGFVPVLAAGAASSFVATLAATPLLRLVERDRSLAGWAAYRTVLAAAILGTAVRRGR